MYGLATLHNQMCLSEVMGYQSRLGNVEIKHTNISPHHMGIIIRINLQKELPICWISLRMRISLAFWPYWQVQKMVNKEKDAENTGR
jgi:hypothetical protein